MYRTGAFLRVWLGTLACSAAVAAPASALPGDLDPTFGTGGTVVTDLGGPELATGAALQADGAIVITGSASGRLLVARYRPDGTPDPAFSDDGFVVTSLGAISGRAVAIQPDGAIVVAAATNTGPSPENVAILRYTPQGVLDPGFDGDGIAIVDVGGREIPTDLAITPDGAIVATARVLSGAPEDLYAIRLLPNGSPDAGFGGDGIANVDLGADDAAAGVVAQPDGRIVLSGFTARRGERRLRARPTEPGRVAGSRLRRRWGHADRPGRVRARLRHGAGTQPAG